mgnify:CR=1 FL=1
MLNSRKNIENGQVLDVILLEASRGDQLRIAMDEAPQGDLAFASLDVDGPCVPTEAH